MNNEEAACDEEWWPSMNEGAVCLSSQPHSGIVVRRPAALMVHKSVWTGWSDAAPVRPSHAENESHHF